MLWFKSISTSALASFGPAWPPSAKNFLNPRILPQRSLDQAGGAVAISDICRDYLDREEVTFGIDEGVALNGFNFLTRIACRPTAKHRVQGPAEKTSTNAPKPDAVARLIERLLQRRALPRRVVVGSPLERLGVLGKSIPPGRSFQFLFRKAYGP